MVYVLNLVTGGGVNEYGLYTGKSYKKDGEMFPCFVEPLLDVNSDKEHTYLCPVEAKRYSTNNRAYQGAISCLKKFPYVEYVEVKVVFKGVDIVSPNITYRVTRKDLKL